MIYLCCLRRWAKQLEHQLVAFLWRSDTTQEPGKRDADASRDVPLSACGWKPQLCPTLCEFASWIFLNLLESEFRSSWGFGMMMARNGAFPAQLRVAPYGFAILISMGAMVPRRTPSPAHQPSWAHPSPHVPPAALTQCEACFGLMACGIISVDRSNTTITWLPSIIN